MINAASVLFGGVIGLLFKGRMPQKISSSVTRAIGLCVCIIGISEAIEGDLMLLLVSIALGSFLGELINIDGGLNKAGLWLQKKISSSGDTAFAEGFVAATLLFCVGAMSVVGSINSGLRNDRSIILSKSILDGVSAMILASSYGAGVLFSVVVIIIYQGGIELFSRYLQDILNEGLIMQISAVGGVMIFAIGLNMTGVSKIKAANLLPGLLFAAGYYFLFL